MILLKDVIFSKDECDSLVNSIKRFTKAKLYFKGDGGVKTPTISPSQRNALSKDSYLIPNTQLYNSIDTAVRKVGFKLNSDKLKFSVVKYKKGHFIYKHRHDRDGNIFLTCVIQLNDSTDYSGGDFLYWIDGVEYTLTKEIGNGIIIGPEIEHEVTIVTSGERHSFVLFLDYVDVLPLNKQSII